MPQAQCTWSSAQQQWHSWIIEMMWRQSKDRDRDSTCLFCVSYSYMCVNNCWKLIVTVLHMLSYFTEVHSCIPKVGIDTCKSVECSTATDTWPEGKRSERSFFFEKPKAKIVPSTAIVVNRCQSCCRSMDFYQRWAKWDLLPLTYTST